MTHNSRIKALVEKIVKHKRLYYAGRPQISDASYDQLEHELRKLDPDHPVLSYIGSAAAGSNRKVAHEHHMLSLDKTYELDELIRWAKGEALLATVKVDGVALSLVFEHDSLALAKTRGNGRIGEDVTARLRWIESLGRLAKSGFGRLEVRGELFCDKKAFVRLAKEMELLGLERPSSPRNVVAGILGRKHHFELARHFRFFAFDLLSSESEWDYETEKFSALAELGFELPEHALIREPSHLDDYIGKVKKSLPDSDIGIDGIVFTYERIALHRKLGSTAHHPRFKLSFKWAGKTAVVEVKSIQWLTSRLGIVTPVAIITPATLSGATITHVSLHNAAHIAAHNLKPGDEIEVVRSGEVIPKFLRVASAGPGSSALPESCPTCEHRLSFDGVRLLCPNKGQCPAQQLRGILNWIKRVGIDSLSEKRLSSMISAGLVETIPDLYRLTVKDLIALPLIQEKMATKLVDNIARSKKAALVNFLSGLGIAGLGLQMWATLIASYPSLEQIRGLDLAEIEEISGFGNKMADQVVAGLSFQSDLIDELLALGFAPKVSKAVSSPQLRFAGMSFVITGQLSRSRAEIERLIVACGGSVAASISKKTTALITNNPASTSSKAKKARALGIAIWSEDKLF